MLINELENKGELQLLIFLLKQGKTKITDITITAAKSTLYHTLNILLDLELIEEERSPPVTRYIKLTGDGTEIAKHLVEIQEILNGKKQRETKKSLRH